MGQLEEGAVEPREEGGPRRKKAKTVVGSDVVGVVYEGGMPSEGGQETAGDREQKEEKVWQVASLPAFSNC